MKYIKKEEKKMTKDKIIEIVKKIFKSPFLFVAFFPLLFFYYEALFHVFTVGGFFQLSTLLIALFAFAYGWLLYIIITLFKNRTVITVLTCVFGALPAVIYLVEYFVYRQFKVLYDVNTVVFGASDALGSFYDMVFSLIFSFDGIFKIILFFLPLVLFFIFRKHFNFDTNYRTRIVGSLGIVYSYGLSLILIFTNSVYLPIFTNEYNFTSAVSNFGLITGIGMDLKKSISGGDEEDFEFVVTEPMITETPTFTVAPDYSGEIVDATPTPKVYGYHKMDLNLEGGSGKTAKLNQYVSSLTPHKENDFTGLFKGKNLIFITAEAFTAELIDPELTPTLYRLATKGIQFTDYYQPNSAGTTGGEYLNIFSMMPSQGGSSFKKTASHYNYMTIGSQLNRLGYYGKAFHNNSYTFYDRHKTHNNLGYSDGFMGYGNGMEQYVKNVWPQSDAEMLRGTLPTYIDKQPFNVYYMSVSGHSAYTRSGNSMTSRHWSRVQHLPYSSDIKGYYAANLDLEDALTETIATLEAKGIADNTVICIATDHFPYGLDEQGKLGNMPNLSELYGYNVTTSFERDHSRLIIWSGCLEKMDPIVVSSPTSSLDILPTLSNLFGTEYDSRLFVGRDVFSEAEALVFNDAYDWKTDYGTYYANKGKFVPKDGVNVPDGYVDNMKAQVRNKIQFCSMVLETDYFRYLFEK